MIIIIKDVRTTPFKMQCLLMRAIIYFKNRNKPLYTMDLPQNNQEITHWYPCIIVL